MNWAKINEEQLTRCETLLYSEDEGMRILGTTGLHSVINTVIPLNTLGYWDGPPLDFNEPYWTMVSKGRIRVIRKRQEYDKRKREAGVS